VQKKHNVLFIPTSKHGKSQNPGKNCKYKEIKSKSQKKKMFDDLLRPPLYSPWFASSLKVLLFNYALVITTSQYRNQGFLGLLSRRDNQITLGVITKKKVITASNHARQQPKNPVLLALNRELLRVVLSY